VSSPTRQDRLFTSATTYTCTLNKSCTSTTVTADPATSFSIDQPPG
jgi:hypothetical protein